MDGILLAIIGLLIIGAFVMAALVLGIPIPGLSQGRNTARTSIRNIVTAQRQQPIASSRGSVSQQANLYNTAKEGSVKRVSSSKLTLQKRLKYAQWKMPPLVFHFCEAGVSLFVFTICFLKFNMAFQCISIFSGPVFMRWLLAMKMMKRFNMFDKDYPSYLLSIVSLIKTGMNVMTALETAAKGMEETSLVRNEIELMIERLRYGVSEDKSIGAFGEDVYHPEIELFVQALLLSRRVGGTLSDTLERLARQVRRRQFFRSSAGAAVSMQRGSIWFIIAILVGIEAYLYVVYPEAVSGALKDELGWQIWQVAILIIMLGIFWVRQITKIRI